MPEAGLGSPMYLDIKATHVLFAALSLALFAWRGALNLWSGSRSAGPLFRVFPHVVDSLLLVCGAWLAVMLRLDPFSTPWLGVKLLCVLAYILLGILAFRLRGPRGLKLALFAAALLLFGFIVSIALTHDPRGIFSLLG